MIDQIKQKYRKLDHKGEFVEILAQDRGLKVSSVRQHWIKFWQIPEKDRERTLELLDQTLAIEKKCRDDKKALVK